MSNKEIVIKTLRKLATFGEVDADYLYSVAKEIEKSLNDEPFCPLCQEVNCDSDCPLSSERD